MHLLLIGLAISGSVIQERPLFPEGVAYTDRAGFHRTMSRLKEGMPATQVRKLLGRPDDVLRGADELDGFNADELWCYGTDEHLGFPTREQNLCRFVCKRDFPF